MKQQEEMQAYLNLSPNVLLFYSTFFIPLLLAKIPMKSLETYTISLGDHQNSYETVTSTRPLVFNYFLITFVLRVPFMTKTEIEEKVTRKKDREGEEQL